MAAQEQLGYVVCEARGAEKGMKLTLPALGTM